MTVEQVKVELAGMKPETLRELCAYIIRLRREADPQRRQEITEKLDSPEAKWLTLDEMDKHLNEE